MELLTINSNYDLTAHKTDGRRAAVHSYVISCRQFSSTLANWRKPAKDPKRVPGSPLSFMTLAADQIWITESEIGEIEEAIHSGHSPVALVAQPPDSKPVEDKGHGRLH